MSEGNGGPQPQAMPQIGVLAQYVKDFSFENPNAPRSITPTGQQPSINIQVNVDAAPMSQTDFEVTLRLEGKAEAQGMLLFDFELVFAGAFRIQNVPPEKSPADRADRMPAAAVSLCARDCRDRRAQRRICAASARPDRFCRTLPPANGRRADVSAAAG